MVSGISSSMNFYSMLGNDTSTTARKTVSSEFDELVSSTDHAVSDAEALTSDDSSSSEESCSAQAGELKQIAACNNCGALFFGGSSMSVCPKCGEQMNKSENEDSKTNEKTDSSSVSSIETDTATTTDAASASMTAIIPPTISL